jgi:transposase
LYNEKTVDETSKLMGVNLSTGHRWLDEWNERGYENLYPKYKNGGRKTKLTDEQFKELDKWMHNELGLNTPRTHKFIKKTFNVKYSEKQVHKIIHKLCYSYKKGHVIYSKISMLR